MGFSVFSLLVLLLGYVCAAPAPESEKVFAAPQQLAQDKDDLTAAGSTTYWGASYPSSGYSGYGVTGYGTVDDRYNSYNGGYDNTYGYNGLSGGYPGYGGYGGGYKSSGGYGLTGYGGNGGYGLTGYGGNGGYGGYGGNGGLNSYYGYNNPSYQSAYNHLGSGYYNKRPYGGNIYSNGITPSLVTGYRGYSRR